MDEFVDIDEHVEGSIREFLGYCSACGRHRVYGTVRFNDRFISRPTWREWLSHNHHAWCLPYCYVDDADESMFWFACDECILIKGWVHRICTIPERSIKIVRGVDY